jgi:hypothetical protein
MRGDLLSARSREFCCNKQESSEIGPSDVLKASARTLALAVYDMFVEQLKEKGEESFEESFGLSVNAEAGNPVHDKPNLKGSLP